MRRWTFLIGLGAAALWLWGCPPESPVPPGGTTWDDDDDAADDDAADDDAADDDLGDDDLGDDDAGDDDAGDDDSGSQDNDGDGWTVADGDCDDTNGNVYPGADDICDEYDNDCDQEMNEDSQGHDQFEPNDAQGFDLGDLTDATEDLDSYIHEPGDRDRFRFEVIDGNFGWFGIDVELSYVPATVDLSLELEQLEDVDGAYVGVVDSVDEYGAGTGEALSYGGWPGWDDSGVFEVVIEAPSGFDCALPYTLTIAGSG